MLLAGKRILVTGASSGLGEALARELARRGSHLVLAARRLENLERVAADIAAQFPRTAVPKAVRCDIADAADVHRMVATAVGTMGGIDVLINNAGLCVYGAAERTAGDDYRNLMAVNFHGAVNAMMETVPYLKRQGGGLLVNISSLAALHGVPYLAAYGASKAALVSVSQSLRTELQPSGVGVLVVYPGYIQTPLFDREKRVGGARRPQGPYASATKVARSIVRAIQQEKQELVLTSGGKALAALRGVIPGGVRLVMNRIAGCLREEGVSPHA